MLISPIKLLFYRLREKSHQNGRREWTKGTQEEEEEEIA
jgi:hypothetical protein